MSKEAMKLALEALKQIDEAMPFPVAKLAQAALREALAEQPAQQEPVAWYDSKTGWTDFHSFKPARKPSAPDAEWLPLYTSPPAQRKPLTDGEVDDFLSALWPVGAGAGELLRAIEAKLKEKNNA